MPLILGASQVHAFARFEQSRAESVGPLLAGMAWVGAALMALALGRGLRCVYDTTQLKTAWRRAAMRLPLASWPGLAWVIRLPYPIVAVVGLIRPQLFVARQVIARCTRAEMAAILAHEHAHVASHDNLVQLLFAITPGAPLLPRLAKPLEAAWRVAIEEAADQSAGRVAGHLELASALVKLTRMAPMSTHVAASGLIGESELDSRVRRLIEAAGVTRQKRAAWLPAAILVTGALGLQMPAAAARLHEVFELLVRSH
jgi:Zn-dependent protease with chaperone function